MTREQKIDMFAMRIDGFTLQEIADKYGVTRERVRKILANSCTESGISRKNYIYPNIADWMRENKVTQKMLGDKLGCWQSTVSNYLIGRSSPSFEFINAILDITKMPYEVAFSKELVQKNEP